MKVHSQPYPSSLVLTTAILNTNKIVNLKHMKTKEGDLFMCIERARDKEHRKQTGYL